MPVVGAKGVAAGVEGFRADDVMGLALGSSAAAIWRGIGAGVVAGWIEEVTTGIAVGTKTGGELSDR